MLAHLDTLCKIRHAVNCVSMHAHWQVTSAPSAHGGGSMQAYVSLLLSNVHCPAQHRPLQ